jgi:hypothetical protein
MTNKIKQAGEGCGLQITEPARKAGLAEESDGDLSGAEGSSRWQYFANVRVYGFETLMLVFNTDEMDTGEIAELVASAARDTESIYLGANARIRPSGNGCMVSLPGNEEAGFRHGDKAPVYTAPDMLAIANTSTDRERLARDLISIREHQVE